MIDRAEWLLQVRGAVASDEQQTLCKINAWLATDARKTLANGFGDRRRQALPGQRGQLPGGL